MKFYFDKFKEVRRDRRYTAKSFSQKMGIARSTLWEWESGKRVPAEAIIRRLAEILNIDVSEISNLKDELRIVNRDFSGPRHAVGTLFNSTYEQRETQFDNIMHEISKLKQDLDQATVIINALLTTMDTMFYIKDANLKYVIANSNFLLNLSFPESFISKGHDDRKFFPAVEAKHNTKQDKEVLYTKKAIISEEGYIPGTRKRKWGLISKVPIMDVDNNAVGIVGTFVDVSERKRESEIKKLLEKVIGYTSYAVWLLYPEPNYKVFYVSPSVKRIYGYSPAKFLESKDFWFKKCLHPDDRSIIDDDWMAGKPGQGVDKKRFRIICADGQIKMIESTLVQADINGAVAYIEKEIS